jgi:AraC-like DNA-binding protein
MATTLLDRVANASPVDKATKAAIQWIARRPHARVEQLSQWLGLSSRQIQRRFTMAVAYGPEIIPVRDPFPASSESCASAGMRRSLAEFAADADYADQARTTREVQRFSGQPPDRLLQSSRCGLRLSSLIQTTSSLKL